MTRDRLLKVVLGLAGVLFVALAYPVLMFVQRDPAAAMLFTVYVTLGVFLLLATRNPAANRSLIAFTGWSSLAHATLMAVQIWHHWIEFHEVFGVVLFGLIGVALITLAPRGTAKTE